MSAWHSYPKVFAIGHPQLDGIFDGPVLIEEKIDGSQIGFGVIDGQIRVRSRGREFPIDAPESMFKSACQTVQRLAGEGKLKDGWVYRGEVLCKPKHNTLAYDRAPVGNIILFDVEIDAHRYLPVEEKWAVAHELGLEVVPQHGVALLTDPTVLVELTDGMSCLGGCKPEGVVVKRYDRFTRDGHVMMGKYVREDFKESHKVEWRKGNPTQGDVLALLIQSYATEARWQKAVQHLAEAGQLQHAPQDIGALIKAVKADVREECGEEIREALFEAFWPQVERRLTGGLPDWYKRKLMESAFGERAS